MLLSAVIAALLAVFVYVTMWWFVSLAEKRLDVADIAWGFGIALVALVSFLFAPVYDVRLQLMMGLVVVWSARLTLHIAKRHMRSPEDARYRALARMWGAGTPLASYFKIFLLQGSLMLVVGYVFTHASVFADGAFGPLALLGLVVWLIGFTVETIADRQLRMFLRTRGADGPLMTTGLWRYSRHPNYFGEVVLWWGLGIMVLSLPYGLLGLVSPILVTYLILRVSGVPLAERELARHPEFESYARTTSVFFPLPPRGGV